MVMMVMRATAPAMIGANFRPSSCLLVAADEAAVPGKAGANGSRKIGSGGEIVVAMGLGGETFSGAASGGEAGGEIGGEIGEGTVGGEAMLGSGATADSRVVVAKIGSGANGGAGAKGETTAEGKGAGHSINGRASASFATS